MNFIIRLLITGLIAYVHSQILSGMHIDKVLNLPAHIKVYAQSF